MGNPLYFGPVGPGRDSLGYTVLNDPEHPLEIQIPLLRTGMFPSIDLLVERDGARGMIRVFATPEHVAEDPDPGRKSVIHIGSLLAIPLDDSGHEMDIHRQGWLTLDLAVTAVRSAAGILRLSPLTREQELCAHSKAQ